MFKRKKNHQKISEEIEMELRLRMTYLEEQIKSQQMLLVATQELMAFILERGKQQCMKTYLTSRYSTKISTPTHSVTVSVIATCQYQDNVLIAQKIQVTRTTVVHPSTTNSMKPTSRVLETSNG